MVEDGWEMVCFGVVVVVVFGVVEVVVVDCVDVVVEGIVVGLFFVDDDVVLVVGLVEVLVFTNVVLFWLHKEEQLV